MAPQRGEQDISSTRYRKKKKRKIIEAVSKGKVIYI